MPLCIFAQSNYHQGYIVKSNGDTVRGYIDYRDWDHTPKSIHFKMNETDKEVLTYDPQTIKVFEIAGMERYISYSGVTSMDVTSFPDLPTGLDTNKMFQTIFLRQVTTGKHITLYQQRDDTKGRFFIAAGDDPINELKYSQYYSDNTVITETTYFRGQLIYYINQFDANDRNLVRVTERAIFNEPDLKKIVDKINGGATAIVKKMDRRSFRFFVGVGASYTKTDFSRFYDQFNNYVISSNSMSPQLNAGLDVFANPNVQRLVLRVELSLYSASPNLRMPEGNLYTFKQYTAGLTPQILFDVYNKDAFKVYIDGGASFNFSTYKNNKITYSALGTTQQSPYQLEPVWVSLPLQIGVVINKKVEFALTYTKFAAYTIYQSLAVSNRTMSAGLKYRLGK